MRALHGPSWRERAHAPKGRRARHMAVTAAAGTAIVAALSGRRGVAALAAVGWLAGTGELAAHRILPGPRDPSEVRRMLLTSAAIPFTATWHSARGWWAHRDAPAWRGLPELVLFDRDGTLVHDVPYNGDPDLVRPVDGAGESLDRLRAAGVRVGVVSNQSGVGSGRITLGQVEAVNRRVEELLGPFDVWQVCPHDRDEGCTCRKPAPGMVKDACAALGVDPSRCLLVGDIGSDVEAAAAAGATGVLVPTGQTRPEEVAAAEHVRADLAAAVDDVLAGRF
jgi:HAD superfamily hydrolase (TIGR01662 family)